MDAALAGVVGGAIGATATLTVTVYTQWRAERQRSDERAHEDQRWERERALEDARWQRESERDARAAADERWGDERRRLYTDALRALNAWNDKLTRSVAFFQTTGLVAADDLKGLPFEANLRALLPEIEIVAREHETASALHESTYALYSLQASLLHGPYPSKDVEEAIRRLGDPALAPDAVAFLEESMSGLRDRRPVEDDVIAHQDRARTAVARFYTLSRHELGVR